MATILLVDDDPAITRSLSNLLKRTATVFSANSGAKALEILREQTINVLITDQRMPELTGVDILQQARTLSPNTTRILLTGYADLPAIVGSVNDGEVYRYINKPWDGKELIATVVEAINISEQAFAIGPTHTPTPSPSTNSNNLLIIDEDILARTAVEAVVGNDLSIYWASSVSQAEELLSAHTIPIIISELKLSSGYITDFIQSLKSQHPNTLTLIQTSIVDSKRIIDLINQGRIYRYLPKPIRTGLLKISINSAMKQAHLL